MNYVKQLSEWVYLFAKFRTPIVQLLWFQWLIMGPRNSIVRQKHRKKVDSHQPAVIRIDLNGRDYTIHARRASVRIVLTFLGIYDMFGCVCVCACGRMSAVVYVSVVCVLCGVYTHGLH